ncbi:hypothetical protein ACTXT7_001779 [Hymenolepis weldensis]
MSHISLYDESSNIPGVYITNQVEIFIHWLGNLRKFRYSPLHTLTLFSVSTLSPPPPNILLD